MCKRDLYTCVGDPYEFKRDLYLCKGDIYMCKRELHVSNICKRELFLNS